MSEERDDLNYLGALGLLAVGALIGAAAALLLAPRSGDEAREILREKSADWARQARERGAELAKRAQETMGDAQVRAQEYLGRGREVVGDTSAQLKASFEAGRGAMREEIARIRGRGEPREGVYLRVRGRRRPGPRAAVRPDGRTDSQRWIACPIASRAASMTASASVGWAWIVWPTSSTVASSVLPSPNSAISSVASAPRMWTPRISPVSPAATILTSPSGSALACALPVARNMYFPPFTARPSARACASVRPKLATCGWQ